MLNSKIRFTYKDIVDDAEYCFDLLQMSDGARAVALRTSDCAPHEFAVRSSRPLDAEQVRSFLDNFGTSSNVMTSLGEEFVVDAHRSWLLVEEALFWRNRMKTNSDEWSDGPWVNGVMPKQYYQ